MPGFSAEILLRLLLQAIHVQVALPCAVTASLLLGLVPPVPHTCKKWIPVQEITWRRVRGGALHVRTVRAREDPVPGRRAIDVASVGARMDVAVCEPVPTPRGRVLVCRSSHGGLAHGSGSVPAAWLGKGCMA